MFYKVEMRHALLIGFFFMATTSEPTLAADRAQVQLQSPTPISTSTPTPRWIQRYKQAELDAESTLPSGTRVYVLPLVHVHDPVKRIDDDFPAASIIIRGSNSVLIKPPDRSPRRFSKSAQLTEGPNEVEFIYVRPGQTPSPFVIQYARLDHIIK